jgi:light-regulated signal transduction histidine kinase (bacteriophytochrome)
MRREPNGMKENVNPEVEKLKATCAELEEQVKLLVKTELKLRRTQAELIESKKIIEAQNRTLEEKVRERTVKLERTNAELADFAHIASHDLKEPLRKVSVNAGRLRELCQEQLNPPGHEYLDRIVHAARRMEDLITDLLRYADVSAADEPFTAVDLSRLAAEVVSDLEASIEKSGGRVNVAALPVLAADPLQMRQLFQNLISNALKFHKPGGTPVVTIREVKAPDSAFCGLAFEDNGIGIDPRHIERIFNVFQRLHSRSEYEGSGIGLAICKKIAERHGGSIQVDSTPGAGAVFTVWLPCRRDPA